jgi:RNA polymerase sigma factor (sigma-70 family)
MDWIWTHFPRLRRMLRRRGRSPEDTDDLIQELFVRVLLYCKQGGQIREPERFLKRATLNLAAKAHRREHRDLYLDEPFDDLALADRRFAPDDMAIADESLERLQNALDALEQRTRDVYYMHRIHGVSYEQIAAHFGISVSAIEKHIARASLALTTAMLQQ